ncbi:alpha-L-rhamnosidase [Flavobacterium aquidurense]|uniref:alpha-L-rhamnosidase n=1 Tax=Flavobacterium frigidimaris TaxID=262320 RepID=A0ABX4BVS1_FLAFR|nr:glycoside hydrolase family 78 protein [Flavobacterium frigidimaris]OXA81501.1 alpha-rhamnosidase [Flavobacterium frigidimaris]SDZ00012.1 alpha-L-rhamnosidase [Flavobacterium aquidurense]
MKKFLLHLTIIISLFTLSAKAQNKISVTNLQSEMLNNPEGIDVLQPRLSWQINAEVNDVKQTAYQILVASTLEKLNANNADLWDSGKVESNEAVNIIYKGKKLENRQDVFWKVAIWTNKGEVKSNNNAHFSIGILTYADWKSTRWIGYEKLSKDDSVSQYARLSARYLRKEINLKKQVKNAKVYIMGMGLYELYINGNKIGDQVLAPVPTDYTKNVKYNVFDVTSQLKEGKNMLGTILGNGRFFAMRQDYKPYKIKSFGLPKMALQLFVEYTDGSTVIIRTDDSWKVTTDGPILSNNEYDGEEYDARKEMKGWNTTNFDDKSWVNARYVQEPGGFYEGQMTPNMKIMGEVKPISIKATAKGTYILDMGQNMVGWLQLRVKGKSGDQVTMKFAESLQADGALYIANLRDAKTTDVYTLKGEGEEIWEPRFIFHGFRFVEVSGFPTKPTVDNFVGKVVYDDIKTTGTFESSDAIMNQIFKNAYWGIRGNYKGMPIDCPQRNERQPWLGDRTTGAYGESFLFDNQTLYAKWLDDIKNAQTQDGGLPDVAPAFWRYYGDNVTWPGTYITVADMLYQQFADQEVIKKQYPYMKKWMLYMEENYLLNDLMDKDKYGDWCVPPESLELIRSKDPARLTDGGLISSAFYYQLLGIMKKFAKISNADADIEYYNNLSERISKAFNAKYLNAATNTYANNTVTANVLPLAFGLVPENIKEKVFQNMVHEVEVTKMGHISTGVIGTQFLMRTLTNFGRGDLAFKLASNKTYPSWGFMVENGATTIWELWNGNTADPSMNSQNHVMLLGDLLIWYYENMAGIKSNPETPGFKQIIMKPDFAAGLTYVNASYESIHGLIKSNWKKSKNNLQWDITVPANTSALVYLPTTTSSNVILNGKKIIAETYKIDGNNLMLTLPSGTYNVSVKR